MSSLQTILNPSDGRKRTTVKLILNPDQHNEANEIPSSPAPSTSSDTTENAAAEHDEEIVHKDHEFHPDCPDSLRCLPDTDGRPQHTLPVILRCAILGSPKKRLTIREIYAAMEEKYSYFKTAGPTWKQSVRHHLSLNRLFERQPRPVTDPGFGSYWTVNLTAPPGTKRPRKRGRANKDTGDGQSGLPKKRGRPRKLLSAEPELDTGSQSTPVADSERSKSVDAPSPPSVIPTLRRIDSPSNEDQEPEKSEYEAEQDAGQGSEEDYESEEEMVHPLDRRGSLVGLSQCAPSRPAQPLTLPPLSSIHEAPRYSSVIDRMQSEISNLRRQSAEAVSVSLRLSEQLVQAQQESSRIKATLRATENMLENEAQRRKEAEQALESEEKRRTKVEDALNALLRRSSSSSYRDSNS